MTFPTNEQQRADVLAMLDGDIDGMEQSLHVARGQQRNDLIAGIEQMREARAAVAELIEAAKDVDAGSGGCPCPTCERLRKALANVGAQS